MTEVRWLTAAMAARRAGYEEDYFRRTFLSRENPHKLLVIRSSKGPKGGRRILVSEASIDALIENETRFVP